MIRVTIERPDAPALAACWDELAPHARNVFMHPTALKAASESLLAVIYVLLAWDMAVEPARLVGFWAMQCKHLFMWPFLETLPSNYSFLSTPVINPAYAEEVMPAFLAAVGRDKSLPNTLRVRDFDAEGPAFEAIARAAAGAARIDIKTDQRPIATRAAGLKRAGSTRKKLRQDWNRLAAAGTVEVVNVSEPDAVAWALESFLEMELSGWKGAGGTALLNHPGDAAFARRLVSDMARIGQASVALLRLDGKPIAAQVLLYSGGTAYTWKTSFDPDYAKFSPGTLLVDKVSMDLLDGGVVDAMDSCAIGEGFMAGLWSGRKPMIDMVVSASSRLSPSFLAVAGYFRGREMLKAFRDRSQRRRSAPAKAAATAPAAANPGASPPALARNETPPGLSAPGPRADRAA